MVAVQSTIVLLQLLLAVNAVPIAGGAASEVGSRTQEMDSLAANLNITQDSPTGELAKRHECGGSCCNECSGCPAKGSCCCKPACPCDVISNIPCPCEVCSHIKDTLQSVHLPCPGELLNKPCSCEKPSCGHCGQKECGCELKHENHCQQCGEPKHECACHKPVHHDKCHECNQKECCCKPPCPCEIAKCICAKKPCGKCGSQQCDC